MYLNTIKLKLKAFEGENVGKCFFFMCQDYNSCWKTTLALYLASQSMSIRASGAHSFENNFEDGKKARSASTHRNIEQTYRNKRNTTERRKRKRIKGTFFLSLM